MQKLIQHKGEPSEIPINYKILHGLKHVTIFYRTEGIGQPVFLQNLSRSEPKWGWVYLFEPTRPPVYITTSREESIKKVLDDNKQPYMLSYSDKNNLNKALSCQASSNSQQ